MIENKLNQQLTYWEPTGETDIFGNPSWLPPEVLPCRWQDKQQMIRDKTGNQVVSESEVWVMAEINPQGRLFRGVSEELIPPSGSYEPRKIGELVACGGVIAGWKVWL